MIDLEELHKQLFGPWNIKYNSQGRPISWSGLNEGSPQWTEAMKVYVNAQMANAVELLADRVDKL